MTIPVSHPVYPFSALVGQERLKQALVLNTINPRIGGVLIRGEKGTAKSTAVRGLARLLPHITIVAGCPYHCPPDQTARLCSVCTGLKQNGDVFSTQVVPTPLVELPVSASEDRVVGTLDIEHAITEGQRRFEPGLLARANRGILYVDEVNLLDDHLVDILLDAAAMGINTVEREGMSVSHPSRFVLIGTMNPEEGELRPQLLDRFGLAVEISGLSDVARRVAVIERRIAYDTDPEEFAAQWQQEEQTLTERIVAARALLPHVHIQRETMAAVARLSLEMEVDGHRADLTILETARTHAAWEGRTALTALDLQLAAELALPHRMRRQPFADVTIDENRIKASLERSSQAANNPMDTPDNCPDDGEKKTPSMDDPTAITPDAEWDSSPDMLVGKAPPGAESGSNKTNEEEQHPSDMLIYGTDEMFRIRKHLEGKGDARQRRAPGRRSRSTTSRKQGRYISSAYASPVTDLALDATLREAAPHQKKRQAMVAVAEGGTADSVSSPEYAYPTDGEQQQGHPRRVLLHRQDLRQKVRVRRTRNAVCFVVDASWSMAAEERMQATKTAILAILRDAYQRRDHVGLVSFRGTTASILLPLTSSVELAQQRLQTMPVGGKTPLARGLLTGYEVLSQARKRDPEIIPLMVVITDGQANVSMGQTPPQFESYRIAQLIARQQIRAIVIDTESSAQEYSHIMSAHASRIALRSMTIEQGLARLLAEHLQGDYYQLDELRGGRLAHMVRTWMSP
jgi:magnesium chelatase subunit D